MRDVDQSQRAFDIVLHQVDEVGTPGDELGFRIGRELADCVGYVGGARIFKIDHRLSPIACWMAATMLG